MDGFRKTTPGGAVIPLDEGQSCSCTGFVCECPSPDSMVCLGTKVMAVKDLEAEIAAGTPFGMKLREIAKKVEGL